MRLIYFEIATQKFGRASLILSKILLTPSAPRKDTLPDLGKRFGILKYPIGYPYAIWFILKEK